MEQPALALAVDLIRDARRRQPVEVPGDPIAELEAQGDQAARWSLVVDARIGHLSREQIASVLSLTARVAASLADLAPDGRAELLLSLMAGEAEAT